MSIPSFFGLKAVDGSIMRMPPSDIALPSGFLKVIAPPGIPNGTLFELYIVGWLIILFAFYCGHSRDQFQIRDNCFVSFAVLFGSTTHLIDAAVQREEHTGRRLFIGRRLIQVQGV